MNPALPKSLSLLVDLYELTMSQSYFIYKEKAPATFDLFVRSLPQNRNYLIACGLKDILDYLKSLRFSKEDISFLSKQKLFSRDFLNFLSTFRFKGDVWAMPEGTVFFADEPVLRVTAAIIEAQIIETFLLNTINLQSMIASKASKVVLAAKGRKVFDFALRRTHGADAGLKVARSSFIAGFDGTSNTLAGKLYNIPVVGTMAHSFVMSFKNEIDSFLAYAEVFPDTTILLVDTYDTKKGIENAIKVSLYLKEKGHKLCGIRLDSGDIASLSKIARKMLDKEGLKYVKIFASGNLDEFKIEELLKKGAQVDSFGVGTNMGTSIDAPSLDVIYKISEVTDEDGNFLPTMKLSMHKVTYPGRKQVYRIKDKKGRFIKDILGLEKENIRGEKVLKKVMEKGKVIYDSPSLDKIKAYCRHNLLNFPAALSEINSKYRYTVEISPGLKNLRHKLSQELKERQ
ncbi:MAG: nicotinate phosphoribosyltransferase [Candidatus Omnitrophica bacterium]|nr:nicotinate phosphoribosyltransferase [Candidatus Omnitrophota bacterium]